MRCEGSAECLHDQPKGWRVVTGKRWVKTPDGMKIRFREDGREGAIDGLTQLLVGSGRNPDRWRQHRINAGDPDRTLAIEDGVLALTDAGGVGLMVKQKADIAVWSPNNYS